MSAAWEFDTELSVTVEITGRAPGERHMPQSSSDPGCRGSRDGRDSGRLLPVVSWIQIPVILVTPPPSESCPVLWTQISRPPRIFMHHPRIRRPPMSPPCALLPPWLPYQPRATESPTRLRRSRPQLRARNGDLAWIFCAACLAMVTWLRSVRSVAGREGFVSRPAPPSAPIARTWIPVPQRAPTHLPTAIGPFPASCCGARCS